MKGLIAALCLTVATSAALAQDKKEAKAKKESASQASAQQKVEHERKTACNKQATEKKLKGESRKKFISSCLKS